jgi:very-short-patch-repair endonuclease
VVFFSMCIGNEQKDNTIQWSLEPNLFNVAITRARAVLRIYGNKNLARSSGIPHVKMCLEASEREWSPRKRENLYDSPWEEKLHKALIEAGIEAFPQYPVQNRFLDLAVLKPTRIDIEVDGEAYHKTIAGDRKEEDYERDLQLRSLGWKVQRFWVYELRDNMDECINKIKKLLK